MASCLTPAARSAEGESESEVVAVWTAMPIKVLHRTKLNESLRGGRHSRDSPDLFLRETRLV